MSPHVLQSAGNVHNLRRARRRRIEGTVLVTDAMTDAIVGRIGNLSETGMLLIATAPLVDDALYQFRYSLSMHGGALLSVEAGMHALWQDRSTGSGQAWVGLRAISIPDLQLQQLRNWLDAPGGRYD
ncbi:PilZ domain-containing protein [Lysobacter korlensis]|uniref:PilZ domain-containing protein n=1 Tax=Lysobacter korlensis TaxID=553636 RepID=A0ABV6RJ20_9GAMM